MPETAILKLDEIKGLMDSSQLISEIETGFVLYCEGSGALSVGGLLKRKEYFKGKKVVAVICGRNIPLELFKRIIA